LYRAEGRRRRGEEEKRREERGRGGGGEKKNETEGTEQLNTTQHRHTDTHTERHLLSL
jgi:hypothetical protein